MPSRAHSGSELLGWAASRTACSDPRCDRPPVAAIGLLTPTWRGPPCPWCPSRLLKTARHLFPLPRRQRAGRWRARTSSRCRCRGSGGLPRTTQVRLAPCVGRRLASGPSGRRLPLRLFPVPLAGRTPLPSGTPGTDGRKPLPPGPAAGYNFQSPGARPRCAGSVLPGGPPDKSFLAADVWGARSAASRINARASVSHGRV